VKIIVYAALLSIATAPPLLLFNQPAQAQRVNYCYPSSQNNGAGNHQNAYADGYREGQQSARDRESYRPRTAGGDFDRGFYDGYYNRPYRDGRYISRECDTQNDNRWRRNGNDNRWRRNGNNNRRQRNENYNRRQRNGNDSRWQRNGDDSRWRRDRG